MNIDETIKYWLDSAENDFKTAKSLFDSAHYDWCLFIGHLVLEKSLKALWVNNNKDTNPPRIHNLLILAKQAQIPLEPYVEEHLDNINTFQIECRYPEYKHEFYKLSDKEFTETNFRKINEIYLWLRSMLKY
jgi:HEPN domain-containing protein